MISRPTFIALIEAILAQQEHDDRIGKAIDVLSEGDVDGLNGDFHYRTPLIPDVLHALKTELDDKDDWIRWWLYDGPDAGKNIDRATVMTTDRVRVVLRNAGDLYDWIQFSRLDPEVIEPGMEDAA